MSDLDPIDPSSALELYLEDKKGTLSQSSIRARRSRISTFVDWLDDREITNLNELTGRLVKEYQLESRKEADWAPSTEKSMMDTTRVFVRWCESIEAVNSGLSERVQSPTLTGDEGVRDLHLDTETAQEVLNNLDRFHYCSRAHVTLAVMWHTMARCGAVRSLDLDDYDSVTQSLRFRHRPETGTPLKNKHTSERHVAISVSLAALLDDWIELKRPAVTDEYGREPLITTRNGRTANGTISGCAYKYTQPCRYKRRCPLDRNPETCESTEHAKISSCPESVSPHPFRRGSITLTPVRRSLQSSFRSCRRLGTGYREALRRAHRPREDGTATGVSRGRVGVSPSSTVSTSSTTVQRVDRSDLRDTSVSQHMSTDSDAGGDGEMEKINVRVPQSLLAQVDDVWEERGYANKSEFIRDALRDAVNPPTQLSEEALEHLAESREQRERGETVSQDDVKDRLGIDD